MKRAVILILAAFAASAAGAASTKHSPDRKEPRHAVPGASWVSRSDVATAQAAAEAAVAQANGSVPILLLETNYYTFLPGEPVQLRVTLHPNGFGAGATMYLYNENRTTGERRYYNAAAGALLPAGQIADLFGAVGSPVAILVPELNDFVLFASDGDTAALSFGTPGALGPSTAAGAPGLFQWVMEVRDAGGKKTISKSNAMYSFIASSIEVSGVITISTTWTANNRYVLNDFVAVASPATLTIEPGTVIYGGDSRASLFVRRGAKIMASGTSRRPIVFTSAQRVGDRAQRDWGSLILLGSAPINEPGGQGFLEGLPATIDFAFGGAIPNDSSGVVRYVRLEFGGFEIEANQEINGLTLGGVGNGTTLEYIQVIQNKDDGFEFFGGTVNLRYGLVIGAADDPIDWDLGYVGKIQFVASIKRALNDENDGNVLIEGDGHPQNFTLMPTTDPIVYNVTGYGTGRTDLGNYGAVLRRGTAGNIHNAIVTNSRRAPVTIRDDATYANAASGALVFDNSLLFGDFEGGFGSSDRADDTRNFLFQTMTRNRDVDPMLAIGAPDLTKTLMPDLTPLPDSPALDVNFVALPPDDGFFQAVDFLGAVGPGNNWILSGWAIFSDN